MQKGNSEMRFVSIMTRKRLLDALKTVKCVMWATLHAPRTICDHVVGEHHTRGHRMFVGTIIIMCGVIIAKIGVFIPGGFVIHLATDAIGYLIHGIGAIPFVESVAKGGLK